MQLRRVFNVRPTAAGSPDIELPLALTFDGSEARLTEGPDGAFRLVIEDPIYPKSLKLETQTGRFEELGDGERREVPGIRVPPSGGISATDLVTALTFLTDVPLALTSRRDGESLIPETDDDRAVLTALGATRIHRDTRARPGIRTFNPIVDAEALQALMPKAAGLQLYADAMALTTDVARYRELWRVLESAFGLQGKDLSNALADYKPAIQLGFDEVEFEQLRTLRGQISHAETSAGLPEIRRAGAEATERLARLKCLVERVLLTKRTWGVRSMGVQELTPAVSWVSADGDLVIRRTSSRAK